MSRSGKGKNIVKLRPFVALTWELLNSKAYIGLHSTSAKMLPYFLGKLHLIAGAPGYDSTPFEFTYSEAERLGCARRSFSRVIRELIKKGFIDPARKGGLKGTGLTTNQFKLSYRWRRYGHADFIEKDWGSFNESQNYRQVANWPLNKSQRDT